MAKVLPLSPHEFTKIRDLLVSVCGIDLKADQDYLVETRLTELATDIGAVDFGELHRKIIADHALLARVVDLMTTNETLWFRDDSCWLTVKEEFLPQLIEQLEKGQPKVRIWSAACSTGQEAYSLAMLINEELSRLGKSNLETRFEIVGTDISSGAVYLAQNARYDGFTVGRGLSKERREQYFTQDKQSFVLNDNIKDRATFREFNLMDSFASLGRFDVVFCRNVAIYFSKDFKENLFEKIAGTLAPKGRMLLGATESLFGLKTPFVNQSYGNGVYYTVGNK